MEKLTIRYFTSFDPLWITAWVAGKLIVNKPMNMKNNFFYSITVLCGYKGYADFVLIPSH